MSELLKIPKIWSINHVLRFFMSKASVRQSQYELLHRESNKNGTIVIF